MYKYIIICLAYLLSYSAMLGQISTKKMTHIWFDNDLLYIPKNKDRDYTIGMGVELTNISGKYNPAAYPLKWLDKLTQLEKVHNKGSQASSIQAFSFKLYTPDDLNNAKPIYPDRPYASIFSVTSGKTSFLPKYKLSVSSSFELGIIGLLFAKDVQGGAHYLVREVRKMEEPYAPKGWNNQISRGGEPVFRYSAGIDKKLDFLTWKRKDKKNLEHFNLSTSGLINLGYQTDLTTSMRGQFGWIRVNPEKGRSIFFHGGFSLRFVGYNALLQGQMRYSVHKLAYRETHPLVSRWQVGLTYRGPKFGIDYSLYSRSAEMKYTDHPRHVWAGLSLQFFR